MPLLPAVLLVAAAAVTTVLLLATAAVPAAAQDLHDGYTRTGETYSTATTFNVNALIGYPVLSSTISFHSCTATQQITINGLGYPAPPQYVTDLYMLWDGTVMTGAGSWLLAEALPGAYYHFFDTKGTGKAGSFLHTKMNIADNMTILVDKADMQYSARNTPITLNTPDGQDQWFIDLYSVLHIRGITVTNSGNFLNVRPLTIKTSSQLIVEDCTIVNNNGPVVSFATLLVTNRSAFVLRRLTGDFHFAKTSDTAIDENSTLSFIDITSVGNLFYYPTTFKGYGTYVFTRITLNGANSDSGLTPKQPEINKKLWVTMKVNGVLLTNEQLSDENNQFNINNNNKMSWDGTVPGTSNCVPAGIAVEGQAEYQLSDGTCVPTCKDGFRPPACTLKKPAPESCTMQDCEVCFRDDPSKCLLCIPAMQPSKPNNDRCECRFPFCVDCPEATVCNTCMDGYKLSDEADNCFNCTNPNCEQCSGHNVCKRCNAGYKLSPTDGFCYACSMDNCTYCSSDDVCGQCAVDHKPANQNTTCYLCSIPNCMECSSDNVCKTCVDGFKISETDGKCYACSVDNCTYCTSDNVCGKCAPDHKPTNEHKDCFLCTIPDCMECSSNDVCKTCEGGYKLSQADGMCYKCAIPNCLECSSDNVCSQCAEDHKPANENKDCFLCTNPNCLECSSDYTCKRCDAGYKLSQTDGVCYQCTIPNCYYCSSDDVCVECALGYKPSTQGESCNLCSEDNCVRCGTENDCQACASGYVLTKDKRCLTCNLENCQHCDVSDMCALCDDNYSVTAVGECVACNIANCTSCSSAGVCRTCECAMGPTEDGKKCVDCSVAHCRYCGIPGDGKQCVECVDGYAVSSSGVCHRVVVAPWVVFLIVVAVTFLIAVCICLGINFYMRKRAMKLQNERDAEERRKNRLAQGQVSRMRNDICILDLGDIEDAASGVRDDNRELCIK